MIIVGGQPILFKPPHGEKHEAVSSSSQSVPSPWNEQAGSGFGQEGMQPPLPTLSIIQGGFHVWEEQLDLSSLVGKSFNPLPMMGAAMRTVP